MDRDGYLYLGFHYLLLVALIFGMIWALEQLLFESVPLWIGLILALVIGLLYPRATRRLEIAPTSWQ